MSKPITTATPLLQLTDVARSFPSGEDIVTVLKNVNLSICAGEMLAIVGQSGSGKSTLMNILGCLDKPSTGSYKVAGHETLAMNSDELASLRREYFGFIFQRYHLLPRLTATENVEIPAIYAGLAKDERRARAHQLLARLGLAKRSHHKPTQLSGGQQQRVSIARALINGGDVILADEPTGALDSTSSKEMLQVLHELHELGHTVIIVTHDMKVASHGQRIIEIHDGHIISDRVNNASGEVIYNSDHMVGNASNKNKYAMHSDHNQAEGQCANKINDKRDDLNALKSQKHLDRLTNKHTNISAYFGRFSESFKMATIAMVAHKMRALLTMLGIIIGIASVVSIVALGKGAQQSLSDTIKSMGGPNRIDVYPGRWGDDRVKDTSRQKPLSLLDLKLLQTQEYIDSISPIVYTSKTLLFGGNKAYATVYGVDDKYFRASGLKIDQGSSFSADAVLLQAHTVVIDYNTRKKLFKSWENPLGKVILIDKLPCIVVAVAAKQEGMRSQGPGNLEVYIPYTTAMIRILGIPYFHSLLIRVKDGFSIESAEAHITKLLTWRHGSLDFSTASVDSAGKMASKAVGTVTLLISIIAMISLLVGGIGLMNIMLVSVTERTHEIGIRMAVGARQRDIRQQFLIEAVLVCLIGGLAGIGLSYAIGGVVAFLNIGVFGERVTMQFSTMSMLAACLCSTIVGVIFGFLPARNAAKLDPIEALARE